MTNVIEMKGAREAPARQSSRMETLIVSVEQVSKWVIPPFQRPIRVNNKVTKLADDLKRDQVIPGIITLGQIRTSSTLYLADGQHRIEAFKISGLPEVIVDVRIVHFATMAEMSEEFELLNSSLVRMRPDDLLRAKELSSPSMQKIRAECAYVGYDNIRRGTSSPMVGMSQLLRCWIGSAGETPNPNVSGRTAAQIAMELDEQSTDQLIRFLHLVEQAWGREPEYYRMWGSLNLTMCMWLYRRLVLEKVTGQKRHISLTDAQFRQCMMSLSGDGLYSDWLPGRIMGERDRSPCYNHMKRIIAKRLENEGMPRVLLPAPPWSSSSGRGPR